MDQVTRRTDQLTASIQEYLGELRFPCTKGELIEALRQHDTPNTLIDQLETAGVDQFTSVADVQGLLSRG